MKGRTSADIRIPAVSLPNNDNSNMKTAALIKKDGQPLLLGNSFPLSLISRTVVVHPMSMACLKRELVGRPVLSFWGHDNTAPLVSARLGVTIRPGTPRPTLSLGKNGYPEMNGQSFQECWIVSPVRHDKSRLRIGEEVQASSIIGWQILRLYWPDKIEKEATTARHHMTFS